MENILYLDDYINLYNKKINKLLVIKPYKNTLHNGIIINKDKFVKKYKKILEENNINNSNINFISEIKHLDLNKNKIYLNCNNSYFYLLYLNRKGNVELNVYKNDIINKNIINNILKNINKKKIYLYGKNIFEIKNILDSKKIEYYYFEDADNLIIKLMINDKNV